MLDIALEGPRIYLSRWVGCLVSILLMLDIALEVMKTLPLLLWVCVSILLMLDIALEE